MMHAPIKPRHYFRVGENDAERAFVQQGFVLYRGVFARDLIEKSRDFILERLGHLERLADGGAFTRDVNGWSVAILRAFERTKLYHDWLHSPRLVGLMQTYLGPDVCAFHYDGLWINVPQDADPVLLKNDHVDMWTGTGINTIFGKTFFTDVDEHNGMSVCPGSHLQGLMPVRNRAIDSDVTFEKINLSMCKAGDLLIWHPLLVHSTTGHSDKNIRISITSRFGSTETPKSTQDRALGYQTLSVGPLNQVLRLVGNDYLLPFRTHGGFVGIDRRMADIYPHSPYRAGTDYDKYLDDVK